MNATHIVVLIALLVHYCAIPMTASAREPAAGKSGSSKLPAGGLKKAEFKASGASVVYDPWLNGFPYRKPVSISNSGSALSDYQVLVTTPIYDETGLVGSWHFNEGSGTSASDSSGNANRGTLTNGPTWVDGKFGKALSFDGSDDYVNMPNSGSLDIADAITLAAWVYPQEAKEQYIINKNPTSDNYRLGFNGWPNENLLIVYSDGTRDDVIIALSPAPLNTWVYLVATYDKSSNKIRLYANGALQTETNGQGKSLKTGGTLYIGCRQPSSYGFHGKIDEVRFYNKVLTPTEALEIYQMTTL